VTPSSNQATSLESQLIHLIQELSGRTLRETSDPNAMFAKGVIGILLAFFLLVFFIWSINLSVKFRAKP